MKNKLLFATPIYSSFLSPVKNTLTKLGMNVYIFDYFKPDLLSGLLGLVSYRLKFKQLENLRNKWINYQLKIMVRNLKPDYFFTIKGEVFYPNTIKYMNSLGITTINWFPDNLELLDLILKTATYYKFYFSVCHQLTDYLNKIGLKTYYLPVGNEADKKILKLKKRYNLVFIGQKSEKRIEYLSNLTDLGFDLWGYSHWNRSVLKDFYHSFVNVKEMKQIFRKSKVVINIMSYIKKVPIDIANLKIFEATSVGAFVLTEYYKSISELFQEDKEIVFFRNPKELRKKAIYYLNHEKKRNQIALNGWKRTKRDHSYSKRLKQMLTIIHQKTPEKNNLF